MNWKTDKRRLATVFLSCSVGSAAVCGLFVLLFHWIRSDPAPGYIDGLRCFGVQSNIARGILSKCEKWESVMYTTLCRAYRMPGNGWKPLYGLRLPPVVCLRYLQSCCGLRMIPYFLQSETLEKLRHGDRVTGPELAPQKCAGVPYLETV